MRAPTQRIRETIVVLEQKYNSVLSRSHSLCHIRPDRGDLKHRSNAVYTEDANACCGMLVGPLLLVHLSPSFADHKNQNKFIS